MEDSQELGEINWQLEKKDDGKHPLSG